MRKFSFIAVVAIVTLSLLAGRSPAQVGDLGEKIDRGLSRLGEQLEQGWAEVRQSVERMGLQGRVYGRLHWDKSLQGAALEIGVGEGQVVTLKGSVPDQAAKAKAVRLATDTVGVARVVDELAIADGATDERQAADRPR